MRHVSLQLIESPNSTFPLDSIGGCRWCTLILALLVPLLVSIGAFAVAFVSILRPDVVRSWMRDSHSHRSTTSAELGSSSPPCSTQ